MSEIWQGQLEKIDDFRWRIPQSYKPGMRVPGLIFADEKLLKDIRQDKALEQVANVAFLPGIVKASLAMPDIHWGFGFCIGGVAATDVDADGVISPGGVGFDINCLTADSRILHSLGFTRSIKEFESCWPGQQLVTMNFSQAAVDKAEIQAYIKIGSKDKIYEIETFSGTRVQATAEHPFWTQDGMVPLKRLKPGVKVALYPFLGVPYDEPSDDVIVCEEDVRSFLKQKRPEISECVVSVIIKELSNRDLLPLRLNSPALPYLIKLLGYCIGDGNIHFAKKSGKGVVGFWGKKKDLESIRSDVAKTGFTCSKVYQRNRKHNIQTVYDTVKFEALESSCKVVASAFAALLAILGCPCGNKTEQAYSVPAWLFKAPLWHKRLFLASFFGAEMSSPKCYAENNYNFYCPIVSMNKNGMLADNGIAFFSDISRLLSEFGVRTVKISEAPSNFTKAGKFNYRLRLILATDNEDLINLYGKIGFEYNIERQYLANVATQFLKYKQRILSERNAAAEQAHALHRQGFSASEIFEKVAPKFVNRRFIERTIYGGRKTLPRIGFTAKNFALFLDEHTNGLGYSGMVWDTISSLTEVPGEDYVYDLTIKHPDHNFVANNFVVSNCGVRLVKTNLNASLFVFDNTN